MEEAMVVIVLYSVGGAVIVVVVAMVVEMLYSGGGAVIVVVVEVMVVEVLDSVGGAVIVLVVVEVLYSGGGAAHLASRSTPLSMLALWVLTKLFHRHIFLSDYSMSHPSLLFIC